MTTFNRAEFGPKPTFDFYISSTGSDTAAGTMADPRATIAGILELIPRNMIGLANIYCDGSVFDMPAVVHTMSNINIYGTTGTVLYSGQSKNLTFVACALLTIKDCTVRGRGDGGSLIVSSSPRVNLTNCVVEDYAALVAAQAGRVWLTDVDLQLPGEGTADRRSLRAIEGGVIVVNEAVLDGQSSPDSGVHVSSGGLIIVQRNLDLKDTVKGIRVDSASFIVEDDYIDQGLVYFDSGCDEGFQVDTFGGRHSTVRCRVDGALSDTTTPLIRATSRGGMMDIIGGAVTGDNVLSMDSGKFTPDASSGEIRLDDFAYKWAP